MKVDGMVYTHSSGEIIFSIHDIKISVFIYWSPNTPLTKLVGLRRPFCPRTQVIRILIM